VSEVTTTTTSGRGWLPLAASSPNMHVHATAADELDQSPLEPIAGSLLGPLPVHSTSRRGAVRAFPLWARSAFLEVNV
jgi:hypothetical protein